MHTGKHRLRTHGSIGQKHFFPVSYTHLAGVSIEIKDGTKIRLPYAVDKKELPAWGSCLKDFISYLQEKPDSRNLTYLASEKHETICCFRCGYTYKGGNVCPKCGYKMNR